jgi:hypothetical protein
MLRDLRSCITKKDLFSESIEDEETRASRPMAHMKTVGGRRMSLITVSQGRCQFCHRTEEQVARIVAGDSGLICDQCIDIEFALPDPSLRRRLVDALAERTEGATPAFIKELMRRIAQHHLAAAAGGVSQGSVDAALHEMLFSGGVLNKRLLGGEAVSQPRR